MSEAPAVLTDSPTHPTPPQIREPEIKEPVIGPAPTTGRTLAEADLAAAALTPAHTQGRQPLPSPESVDVVHADAATLIKPAPELPEAHKPAKTPPAPLYAPIVKATEFTQVEHNIAGFIGQHINPAFLGLDEKPTDQLKLKLSNEASSAAPEKTALSIMLWSPEIGANFNDASIQISNALTQSHPVFRDIAHPISMQRLDDNTIKITFDNFSSDQYASLMHKLAQHHSASSMQVVTDANAVQADSAAVIPMIPAEAISGATPPLAAVEPIAKLEHPPEPAPLPGEPHLSTVQTQPSHAAAAALSAVPAMQTQAPVIQLGNLQPKPEMALGQAG